MSVPVNGGMCRKLYEGFFVHVRDVASLLHVSEVACDCTRAYRGCWMLAAH